MFNILEAINEIGFTINTKHKFKDLEVIEADNYINSISLSRYLFLYLSKKDFNIFIEKNYTDFENNLLRNVFYNLDGDLSWNLYLIIVLNNEEYENIENSIIIQFEKNDKFARKMVVSTEQFLNVIPIGKSVFANRGKTDINPVNEWIDILEKDEMGFCIDEYSNRKFQNFLSGKNVGSDIRKGTAGKIDVAVENHKIDKINIKENFRSHCYGKNIDIDLGDVNLLYGPNGSGKTSLLEAIELVVTGNVRKRQKDNSADIKEDLESGISLTIENGHSLEIPETPAIRKKRESTYYQNRASKHGKDSLNSIFHRYNYFSFEDVYMFSFLDEQPEFTEEFSKVIFGEEVKKFENNFGRYQEEFKKSEKQLKERRDEYKILIESLTAEIEDNLGEKVDVYTLNKVFKELITESEECNQNSEIEDIKNWIEKNRDIIKQILVKMELIVSNSEGLDSLYSTREEIIRASKELEQVKKEIENKQNELNELSKSRESSISRLTDIMGKASSTEAQLKVFNAKKIEFNNKVVGLNDVLRCKRIVELSKKRNDLNPRIEFGNKVRKKWEGLLKIEKKNGLSESILESELIKCMNNISNIEKNIKKLDNEITYQEKLNSELQILISEIKSLGDNYIKKTDKSVCPLCKHKFLSRDELIREIANTDINDSSTLVEMYNSKKILTKNIEELTTYESDLKASIKITNEISDAYNFIFNNAGMVQNIDENAKLTKIKEFFKETETYEKLISNIDDELKMIVNEVYTIDRIKDAINFCDEYLGIKSMEFIEENILKTKDSLNSLIRELNETYENLNKEINELYCIREIDNKKYDEYSNILKQGNDKRNLLTARKNLFEKLVEEISDIDRVILKENDSWKIMLGKFRKCKEQMDAELVKMDKLQNKNKKNSELQDMQKKFETISGELAICRKANRVINNLTPSSEYAREFIESNIVGISNLFGSLHFPKEFEGLGLNENGELIGYRGNGHRKKEVPIYLMSTGQRTAVVLSVFFRFFNSLDTIPKFILLDEPVSNIDDLNTLALFDFLRELSLKKDCQIFFTTANYQVAKLFRRKFSFLRDNFHSFRFERNGNSKTAITREHYVEYSDVAIKEEIVF